ncbi:c-type cytochrome [Brevundimonas sp.]|uniref:c-type cytochrome n=1 Tax=Brevundimonas sp. TaxID=1871086 RepID=UPI003A0FFEE1
MARGRELYDQNCTQCHGLTGRGDGPLAKTLAVSWERNSVERLAEAPTKGGFSPRARLDRRRFRMAMPR